MAAPVLRSARYAIEHHHVALKRSVNGIAPTRIERNPKLALGPRARRLQVLDLHVGGLIAVPCENPAICRSVL